MKLPQTKFNTTINSNIFSSLYLKEHFIFGMNADTDA